MRKTSKHFFIVALVISLIICASSLVACDSNTYTVKFDSQGGSAISAITQKEDMQISSPIEPTKTDNVFVGWYYDIELNNPVSFPFALDKNYKLYAKWINKGTGTQDDPYVIATKPQLAAFAEKVNGGEKHIDKYFELFADIDLEGSEWTQIGLNEQFCFAGSFDGGGHTVSNFKITSADDESPYCGLFGYNAGRILNLNVGNFAADIAAWNGRIAGLAAYNSGEIINCYAQGDITVDGVFYIYSGILVGDNNGTIADCHAQGNINADGRVSLGGLAGRNTGTAKGSYAVGDVEAGNGALNAGGLVGYNGGIILDCYATGNASVKQDGSVGGLVGENSGTITESYAVGNATGINDSAVIAGGLIGHNNNTGTVNDCHAVGNVVSTCGGGLVGSNNGVIKNSYALGNIKASSVGGGLIGTNGGTVTSCYAAGNVNVKGNLAWAGGLVGYFTDGLITFSYSAGEVVADSLESIAGGLVGYFGYYMGISNNNKAPTAINCYSISKVNATGSNCLAGGLVGYIARNGLISRCYAAGDVAVTGNTYFGISYAGGLVGESNTGKIIDSYATGNLHIVSTHAVVGGLLGNDKPETFGFDGALIYSEIVNSYYYLEQTFYREESSGTSTTANSFFGTGCYLTELNSQSFFINTLGWDSNIWDLENLNFANGAYPKLKI